jgi:coniferyl-aldehyde dehydrogenase
MTNAMANVTTEVENPAPKKASPAQADAPTASSEPTFEEMKATLSAMHKALRKARTPRSLDDRVADMNKLERMLLGNKEAFCKAIDEDFGHRSKHETLLAEVMIVHATLKYARENLAEWMATEERDVNLVSFPARAEIMMQPLGVIGIIAPWNYPMQLALAPLVGALAAGNRVMIKPSELVPATSALLAKLIGETFASDHVHVVTGGVQVAVDFGRLPFDHIVFTGSTQVGKMVMRAAAENLTPVTLELGGKSPTIIGPNFPLDVAAERILHGKLLNAGQTCIAPDYVLVPKGKERAFADALKLACAKLFPTLRDNPDYTSIVSERHKRRLQGLLQDARDKGAEVIELNPANETFGEDTRKLVPALVIGATDEMTLLQEEIFGPLLPILPYGSVFEAIDYVNDRPRPLALYVFDYDDANVERILAETISGGVSVNETMLHIAQDALPFGGVGPSGMGHYHGREGFLAMCKMKPIVYQSRLNATGVARPPYAGKMDLLLKVLVGK